MAQPITLRVLTEAGIAVEDQAVAICAPGEVGYLGVLHNHAPLVTTLQPGTLTWRRPDGHSEQRRIGTGLLEVSHNAVTILTSVIDAPQKDSNQT